MKNLQRKGNVEDNNPYERMNNVGCPFLAAETEGRSWAFWQRKMESRFMARFLLQRPKSSHVTARERLFAVSGDFSLSRLRFSLRITFSYPKTRAKWKKQHISLGNLLIVVLES